MSTADTTPSVSSLDERDDYLQAVMQYPSKDRTTVMSFFQKVGMPSTAVQTPAKPQRERTKLINLKSADDMDTWLVDAVRNNKYVVLLTFRGSWCAVCKMYMEAASTLKTQCDQREIAVFGVCSQDTPSYVQKMQDNWALQYPLVSDAKNLVASRFELTVTKASTGAKIRSALAVISKKLGTYSEDYDTGNDYKDGMVQPSIVVIDRRCLNSVGNPEAVSIADIVPFYTWTLKPMHKNTFGASERVMLEHVLTIIDFHDQVQNRRIASALSQNFDMRSKAFKVVLRDAELRASFMEHLKDEFNCDPLLFVADYESLMAELKQGSEAKEADTRKRKTGKKTSSAQQSEDQGDLSSKSDSVDSSSIGIGSLSLTDVDSSSGSDGSSGSAAVLDLSSGQIDTIIERIKSMATKYLIQDAAFELNVPAMQRNSFFKALHWGQSSQVKLQNLLRLLAEIHVQVITDMQSDTFLRYLSSPRVLQLIKKYPQHFTAVRDDASPGSDESST